MSKRYHEVHGHNDRSAPGAAQAGSGYSGVSAGDLPQCPDGSRPARLHRPPGHAVVRAVVGSVCWQPLARVTRAWRSRADPGPGSGEACPGSIGSDPALQAPEEPFGPLPLRRPGPVDRLPAAVQALPRQGPPLDAWKAPVMLRWGPLMDYALAGDRRTVGGGGAPSRVRFLALRLACLGLETEVRLRAAGWLWTSRFCGLWTSYTS